MANHNVEGPVTNPSSRTIEILVSAIAQRLKSESAPPKETKKKVPVPRSITSLGCALPTERL
jgi:hypothetical protein